MEHREQTLPAFHVVGVQIRTNNADAIDTIGPLWGRVMTEGLIQKIPDPSDEQLIAVYSSYESDHTGAYDYTIGRRVNSVGEIPEGMAHVEFPESRYAVVTSRGEMPDALVQTWMKIWQADLPRAFTADFEVHDFETPDQVEIWLSLK
ncbi:MAG: GyrI-like domain-containing protein [Planctomycetes bacterium]|nr:GyrI-like domain-containing protein [Planctomycetota bacterium]